MSTARRTRWRSRRCEPGQQVSTDGSVLPAPHPIAVHPSRKSFPATTDLRALSPTPGTPRRRIHGDRGALPWAPPDGSASAICPRHWTPCAAVIRGRRRLLRMYVRRIDPDTRRAWTQTNRIPWPRCAPLVGQTHRAPVAIARGCSHPSTQFPTASSGGRRPARGPNCADHALCHTDARRRGCCGCPGPGFGRHCWTATGCRWVPCRWCSAAGLHDPSWRAGDSRARPARGRPPLNLTVTCRSMREQLSARGPKRHRTSSATGPEPRTSCDPVISLTATEKRPMRCPM